MKNIATIIKKEFKRFFCDSRLVLSTLILPGLLIFLLYTFIGSGIINKTGVSDDYVYKIYAADMPATIKTILGQSGLKLELMHGDKESALKDVENKNADLFLIFPPDFNDRLTAGGEPMNIEIYMNSSKKESSDLYNKVTAILNAFEESISNIYDINKDVAFDLASDSDIVGTFFSMLLPFLVLTFLFSGCMAVAPESIAGEKERGTIATLLVTPIKRRELAIGKIISLSVISILSALSSFIGTVLSMPKMMGMDNLGSNVYGIGDYLGILGIIVSTVLIIVAVIAVISAFARTVKEASSLIMPLMIVVMVIGITSMFSPANHAVWLFMIPIYNSVIAMVEILSFNFSILHFAIMLGVNLAFTALLVVLLTRMFNSERVMFKR